MIEAEVFRAFELYMDIDGKIDREEFTAAVEDSEETEISKLFFGPLTAGLN